MKNLLRKTKYVLKIKGKCDIIVLILFFERNNGMEIRLTLDRIEEGRAILLDSGGKIYECGDLRGFSEGDILLCSIDGDGSITVIEKTDEETEKKREEMSSRLRSLFSRGDK